MLEHLVGHGLTKAVFRWVSGGRRSDAAPADEGVGWQLSFGIRFRLLWTGMSGAATGFLILGIWGELTEGLGIGLLVAYFAVFIPLCVYSLLLLLRAYFYRVELRDWGLEEYLPGGQRTAMRWEEVAFISYSKPRDSLVFHRIDKKPLRLSMQLDGLGQLRLALERACGQLAPVVAERLSRNETAPFAA